MTTREHRLIETFVRLADSLVSDFDAEELLHDLVEQCVELLEVDAAGVMLAMETGPLRAAAASSRDMSQLEIFQVAAEEGPSHEAYTTGAPVLEEHLAGAESRWPNFTRAALDLGFAAAHGFPLRLRERTIGALNLFQSRGRASLSEADRRVAQGFADVAAISLIQDESLSGAQLTVDQLTHALEARVTIEQAKGVMVERLAVPPQRAFERLRKHARDHNRRVRDVAHDVIDGRLDV